MDEVVDALEIKSQGKKHLFKKKLHKVKDDFEKKVAEEEEQKLRMRLGESFELLQKRSSVVF